jgi:hypothetical protein
MSPKQTFIAFRKSMGRIPPSYRVSTSWVKNNRVFQLVLAIHFSLSFYQEIVNPSTPRSKGRGLPFDELKALSVAEGLRVDPESGSFTPFSKTGLDATERVNSTFRIILLIANLAGLAKTYRYRWFACQRSGYCQKIQICRTCPLLSSAADQELGVDRKRPGFPSFL